MAKISLVGKSTRRGSGRVINTKVAGSEIEATEIVAAVPPDREDERVGNFGNC